MAGWWSPVQPATPPSHVCPREGESSHIPLVSGCGLAGDSPTADNDNIDLCFVLSGDAAVSTLLPI